MLNGSPDFVDYRLVIKIPKFRWFYHNTEHCKI